MKRKFTKLIALLCAGVLVVQSTSSSIAAVSTGKISVSENSESNDTGDVSENQTVSQNEEEQSVSENEEEKFEKQNIYLYTYDGYQVSYSITEEWGNAYNAEITLENTGENTIKNWKLKVDKLGDIINIWNAYLEENDSNIIISNMGWNQDVLAGMTVSFGMTVAYSDSYTLPSAFRLIGMQNTVTDEQVGVECSISSQWNGGYIANIDITNNSEKKIEDWELGFESADTILSIWNAKKAFEEDNYFVVENEGYNSNILPGQTVTFGLQAEYYGQEPDTPHNFILSEITESFENTQDYLDYVAVVEANEKLAIEYNGNDSKDCVTQNVVLQTQINEVEICWSSSDAQLINTNGNVTRPEGQSQTVTLTAVLCKGNVRESREFELTVIRQKEIATDTRHIRDLESLEELYLYNEGDTDNLKVYLDDEGYIDFISGSITDEKVETPEEALLALYHVKTLMGCKEPLEELAWSATNKSLYGKFFVFNQIYEGVEIYGTSITVGTDNDGNTVSLQSSYHPNLQLSTLPQISQEEIDDVMTNMGYTVTSVPKLYIYEIDTEPVLVWCVEGYDRNGELYDVLLNANTGEEVFANPLVQENVNDRQLDGKGIDCYGNFQTFPVTYTSSGNNIYAMRDIQRNIVMYDMEGSSDKKKHPGKLLINTSNRWNDYEISTYTNVIKAYDFFYFHFGRKGFDGERAVINVAVRDLGKGANAYHSGGSLYFGYGGDFIYPLGATLDIVGHEFTHGVINVVTELGQCHRNVPGTINEGYADILGNFVEGDNDSEEWLFGEDNIEGKKARRSLECPEEFGQPSVIGGENYYEGADDNGGVHYNNTIISHSAYLMWNNGIKDKDKLAKLWYESLFYGYDAKSGYTNVYVNVMNAANKMGMSENEKAIIDKVFDEVGITVDSQVINGTNSLSGTVIDINGNPLKDVKVSIMRETTITSFHKGTQSNGSFFFGHLVPGHYIVTAELDGYYTIKQRVTLKDTKLDSYCNVIEMIPTTYVGEGYATGRIEDAVTGKGVEGLSMYIREGMNFTDGKVVGEITSQKDGTYRTPSLTSGWYCIVIMDERNLEGEEKYLDTYFNVKILGGKTSGGQNATVSTVLNEGQVRIILRWGNTPRDLDSHLTCTTKNGTLFHIYYSDKTYKENGMVIADLDLDDTTSYGPETTTIYEPRVGSYLFEVYNYSGSPVITNSQATVQVYLGGSNEPDYIFSVPTNKSGRTWKVFRYYYREDGSFKVSPVNEIV